MHGPVQNVHTSETYRYRGALTVEAVFCIFCDLKGLSCLIELQCFNACCQLTKSSRKFTHCISVQDAANFLQLFCHVCLFVFFVQWLDKWSASSRRRCCCWQHYDNYGDVLDSFVCHYVSLTDKGKSHPKWHDPHSFSLEVLVILSATVSLLLFILLPFLT